MIINKINEQGHLTISLEGRLDSTTAPDLDLEIESSVVSAEKLTFDFSKLEYISSAGLRTLLKAHTAMCDKGGMNLKNVNETVMEVLEITGFTDVLIIE